MGTFSRSCLALLKMNRAAAHGYERAANNRRIQHAAYSVGSASDGGGVYPLGSVIFST